MGPLELANLPQLMQQTRGSSGVRIALIGRANTPAASSLSAALLFAPRKAIVPGICPACTLLPDFAIDPGVEEPERLNRSILAAIDANAHVMQIEIPSKIGAGVLSGSLGLAALRGVLVVTAADESSGAPLHHPWPIVVSSSNSCGLPKRRPTVIQAIREDTLLAPGADEDGRGACAFVTGALALLCSEFSSATAAQIRAALLLAAQCSRPRAIVPPLLNALGSWQLLAEPRSRKVA
jgi:hypothetical protein